MLEYSAGARLLLRHRAAMFKDKTNESVAHKRLSGSWACESEGNIALKGYKDHKR